MFSNFVTNLTSKSKNELKEISEGKYSYQIDDFTQVEIQSGTTYRFEYHENIIELILSNKMTQLQLNFLISKRC